MFELDHIGVAVESIESVAKTYEALGWKTIETEVVPTEKVKVGFLPFENKSDIELLEATSEDSIIAKFIQKRGPGVHHICFRVKDIDSHLERLKNSGVRLIDETPRAGAKNCRVAFIHPKSTGGVLIELSEKTES